MSKKQGNAVIVCGDTPVLRLRDALARRMSIDVDNIVAFSNWAAAANSPGGQLGVPVALRHGFRLPGRVVLAVHPERGLAQLSDLVTEHQAGKSFECLSLSFRGEIRLLVPATEAGRVWRYGVGSAARLDRLDPPT